MAKNRVQFQKSMSLRQFMDAYGSEAQCQEALLAWRWPQGFVCPACGEAGGHVLRSRRLIQCKHCRHQCSLTSATLFAATKLPLRVWFQALYFLTQAKNGISALELSRSLGISDNSAWLIKHKLMQAMKEREAGRLLSGLVQLDDAYWGGKRSGKSGRGARGKRALVAAVQTDEEGHPQRMRFSCVSGFRLREIARWSKAHLSCDANVTSDGLWCFAAVTENGCTHRAVAMNRPDVAKRRRALKWADTMLGNVKNAMHGTYHAIGLKHLPRYLAEFCYRFNRRHDLSSMLKRLAIAATQTPPMPYRLVKLAEPNW
jgi:hypothetical protein